MKYIVEVKPTETSRSWILTKVFNYKGWSIEEGFQFDGASIPIGMRWLFPHGGAKFPASCFHDWGYRKQEITKEIADREFLNIMLENGVSKWRAYSMYQAVRICGHFAWKKRAKELQNEGTRGNDMR